ncbi:MAG: diguanylate cyclase (GGDEF)-like protein [Glaciecola sp.]
MTDSQKLQNKLKQNIAVKLVLIVIIACALLLPVTVITWLSEGYHHLHLVHIVFLILALALYFRPSKQLFGIDVALVTMFLSFVMLIGAYGIGINSGLLALLFSSCLVLLYLHSSMLSAIYGFLAIALVATILLLKPDSVIFPYDAHLSLDTAYYVWNFSIISVLIAFVVISTLLAETYKKFSQSTLLLAKKKEELDYLANHDHLTGLSSQRLAQEQLELTLNMAKRHEFKAAILYIDIDEFSLINDALGHDAGDYALKEVAKRIKELIRDTDIACRQGGDEFLVILHFPVSKEACDIICKRLIAAFDQRVPYKDHEIKINLSIGVAIFPDHGDTQYELRTKADKAMQFSKKHNKHNFTFADEIETK